MNLNKLMSIMTTALTLSLSINVQAATTTGNFQTNAVMNASCSVSTWIPIWFGNITNGSTSYTANEPFNVKCTKGTPWTVSVSSGNGTVDNRYMLGKTKGDKLYYNLYTSTSYTTIYGDATAGTVQLVGTGNGANQYNLLEAKMLSGQWVTPDVYEDNITITVSY